MPAPLSRETQCKPFHANKDFPRANMINWRSVGTVQEEMLVHSESETNQPPRPTNDIQTDLAGGCCCNTLWNWFHEVNHDLISSSKTRWLVSRIKHQDRNKPYSVASYFCCYYKALFFLFFFFLRYHKKPVYKELHVMFLNYPSLAGFSWWCKYTQNWLPSQNKWLYCTFLQSTNTLNLYIFILF